MSEIQAVRIAEAVADLVQQAAADCDHEASRDKKRHLVCALVDMVCDCGPCRRAQEQKR